MFLFSFFFYGARYQSECHIVPASHGALLAPGPAGEFLNGSTWIRVAHWFCFIGFFFFRVQSRSHDVWNFPLVMGYMPTRPQHHELLWYGGCEETHTLLEILGAISC